MIGPILKSDRSIEKSDAGELSTGEGLVIRKGGQTKVAYRGTDWSNVQTTR